MFKRAPRSKLTALCVALCALFALGGVANASAATLFVSNSFPAVVGGRSCSQPAYNSIQAALNTGGTKINVCSGTYAEQLTITHPAKLKAYDGIGTATVALPASPVNTKTACDEAPGTGSYEPDQDGISICTSGTVSMTGLNIEPKWPSGTCDDSLYGVLVAGGATLKATNVKVNGGGAFPINGCQGGIGIQIGMAWTTPVEVGHAKLKGVTVTNYQKNGLTIDGAGSTAKIKSLTVTGAGATPETAQNGIQISNGALAKIKSATVSGNECDHSSCGLDGEQATGLLFYGAAAGSTLSSSKVSNNDLGAYYYSTSASQPSSPEVTLSSDTFSSNRYEGVYLDQGKASLSGDTINGTGDVGIDLAQYAGQTLRSESSASGSQVNEQSEAAIKVESDKEPTDKPGKFSITNSTFSGDASVLINESNNFQVVF